MATPAGESETLSREYGSLGKAMHSKSTFCQRFFRSRTLTLITRTKQLSFIPNRREFTFQQSFVTLATISALTLNSSCRRRPPGPPLLPSLVPRASPPQVRLSATVTNPRPLYHHLLLPPFFKLLPRPLWYLFRVSPLPLLCVQHGACTLLHPCPVCLFCSGRRGPRHQHRPWRCHRCWRRRGHPPCRPLF